MVAKSAFSGRTVIVINIKFEIPPIRRTPVVNADSRLTNVAVYNLGVLSGLFCMNF